MNHRTPSPPATDDALFGAFLLALVLGPLFAAIAFSAWWLLLYVPVVLILGL